LISRTSSTVQYSFAKSLTLNDMKILCGV
jgi:hypothetical protein